MLDDGFNARGPAVPEWGSRSEGRLCFSALSRLAKVVLIEDADLTTRILVGHLAKFERASLWVYDLSKALRLSRNHIYWITGNTRAAPPPGEPIWLKSSP